MVDRCGVPASCRAGAFRIRVFPRTHLKLRAAIWGGLGLAVFGLLYWSCRCSDDGVVGRPGGDLTALESRLRGTVEHLATAIGERNFLKPKSLDRAADWIGERFRAAGYRPTEHTYRGPMKIVFRNVEATLSAPTTGPLVVIGAHYDTATETPGADDNASGVAAMLEVARALAGARLARSVRFVAFANEEPPFFESDDMGSRVYARALVARGERAEAMVALECVGFFSDTPGSQRYPPILNLFYPDTGRFAGVVGNLKSHELVTRVTRLLRRSTDVPIECCATWSGFPGVSWSDHSSFWKIDTPAVMVTDTALYRTPHYHQTTDLPGTLDFGRMARLTAGLVEVVRSLGGPG